MPSIHSASPDRLRVLQFTDLHLFASDHGRLSGVDTAASFRACLEQARLRHWPADLVVLTGDLAHEPTPAAYQRLQQGLAPIPGPVCAIPGNHDDGEHLRAVRHAGQPLVQRAVRWRDWQVLLLDTTVPGADGGALTEAELDHLRACLRRPLHTLVCLHHSPVAVGSAWLDEMRIANAGALFSALEGHPRPGALLWGHVHQEYEAAHRGWRLLATPSTCVQFAPRSDGFALDRRPPGYRWLHLHSDGRLETGVERLDELPPGLSAGATGY